MHNLVEQINDQMGRAQHVLIAIPKGGKGDDMCAAVALAHYLRAQKKQVDIVCDKYSFPSNLNFLKEHLSEIKNGLPVIQALDIEIDITDTPLSEMSYDVKDNKLHIHVAIKKGTISEKQVKSKQSSYRYDTIITIGVLCTLGGFSVAMATFLMTTKFTFFLN